MEYEGIIIKLFRIFCSGVIRYINDEGEVATVYFKRSPSVKETKRIYWMKGDRVRFELVTPKHSDKDYATHMHYLGNKRVEGLMNCDVEEGGTLDGRLEEFDGRPYFIDDDYGVLFSMQYESKQVLPEYKTSITVELVNKEKLIVGLIDPETNDEVDRLLADRSISNDFEGEILRKGFVTKIKICGYDVIGTLRKDDLSAYEVGDIIPVYLTNKKRMFFRLSKTRL